MSLSSITNGLQAFEQIGMFALGAEFGALEFAQAINNQAMQSIGQALQSGLQQLQQAGMPAVLVKDLQKLVNQVMQQLQQQTNPTNQAANNSVNQQLGNQINNLAQQLVQMVIQQILQEIKNQGSNGSAGAGGGKGAGGSAGAGGSSGAGGTSGAGGSSGAGGTSGTGGTGGSSGWLSALAAVLGKLLDQKAAQLQNEANNVSGANASQVTQLQADTQLFTMMMNAFTNIIQSIGQGFGKMVNKD
jgi:hypothetical protein